jgi:glycosyltransferase involved in cell wall biosynthesis
MKVLIVNTSDTQGGAARAAYRLHKGLQSIGIESQMLVQSKKSDDPTVSGPQSKLQKVIGFGRYWLDALPVKFYKNKINSFFSPAWLPFSTIVNKINASDADLVHLHWIAAGMIRIEDIAKIKKPIVWSLLDMWAFTGGCHYDSECGKYVHHCESCPVLNSNKKCDLSYDIFKRKEKTFAQIPHLTIVCHSRWLTDCAKKSALLVDRYIVNIPSPIDTYTFRPFNKKNARDIFGLPQDKKMVLFGAIGGTNDPRKGFKELTSALRMIKSSGVELAIFGSGRPVNFEDFGFPTHYVGHITNDHSLRVLYAATDVMVVPSIQENLSNTIMESLACGIPVVGFDIGGNQDMIDHQQNGYLASPFDPTSLADGIDWVLNHPTPQNLSQNARQKVMETFEVTKVAKQYAGIYESVLKSVGKWN